MKNYENLTSELKEKYREELKRDDEAFDTEFIRITNLENKIINKYGFNGIKLIFESKNGANFYQLGELPNDCPWVILNHKTIAEFISDNFQSISNKIPNLITSLKERCKFIFAEKRENTWHLHYLLYQKLYDDRDYFTIYTGGSPLLNAEPNENLKRFNWTVPNDLKTFYKIHNGFGEILTISDNLLLGNKDIKVMAEVMNPICKKQNITPDDYSFDDLLEFFSDGCGNAQCFYKNNGNSTVDWYHEDWEISEEIDFFEFIDKRMSAIDEK